MEYRRLGRTDLKVSAICLGTMTFGRQNTEADGHAQLDAALDLGVNFLDTAEMYPVPRDPNYYGRTEQVIGSWIKSRGGRDKYIIATKAAGPLMTPGLRPGNVRLDRTNILAAVDSSLKRLNTDYIDLYQLHWPDRSTNTFGKLGYKPVDETFVPIEETLGTLADLVAAGKIRHIGVSNETPWGVMEYLTVAKAKGWPRIQSIQNPYSLLNRTFEIGLAEFSHREDVGLLAYSPIGMGVLAGKYRNGARPAGARMTLFPDFKRYFTKAGIEATDQYLDLAHKHGLVPEQMAIAFTLRQPFMTSVIIGASTVAQLKTDVASTTITLSDEILNEIEDIHCQYTNPCP